MSLELISKLLREFDYQKNGKQESVNFLICMLHNLILVEEDTEVI